MVMKGQWLCMLVSPLDEIDEEYHDRITRPARGGKPEQKLKYIASKMVGRVPAKCVSYSVKWS